MTKYNIQGSNVFMMNDLDLNIQTKLPVDVYAVCFNPMSGQYWLSRAQSFEMPKKIYGDANAKSDRILATFADRSGATGVLLSGVKGSGKSLTMKLTAIKALEKGYPVIIVNSAHSGTGFNEFIQSIDIPCVVIFDEFEKVYEKKGQEELLTLFDGVYSTKKLFMLTVNDTYRVNAYMNNRPGRIYYSIEYKGLTPEFIREFCEDVLKDKTQIDKIVLYSAMFSDFNFDMLKAICEELNRYGENFTDLLPILNVRHDGTSPEFVLTAYNLKGEAYPKDCFSYENFTVSLLADDEHELSIFLGPDVDKAGEKIVYHRRKSHIIVLEPMATENVARDATLTKFEFAFPEHDLIVLATRRTMYQPKYMNMF